MKSSNGRAVEIPPDDISPEDLLRHLDEADELDELASRDEDGSAYLARYPRAPALVDAILSVADELWVSLSLPGGELVRVRPGQLVVVAGATGSGKSSLVNQLAVRHAREHGPVVVMSCELPADETAARMIGMQTESSWPEVLGNQVPESEMRRVLNLARLIVLARKHATLVNLAKALDELATECPDQPRLAVVDYVQLVPGEADDLRRRVSDTMERIDELARSKRTVVLVVSQMSRANARAVRAGQSLGADTIDSGAETAAIERFASVTLAIGPAGAEAEDGSRPVQLSLGKSRMGGGDRVYPACYDGRTGRWRLDGDARPAGEVRAEAVASKTEGKSRNAEMAIFGAAESSETPMTRDELRKEASVGTESARVAINALLDAGRLVEVRQRRPRARCWLLWTRSRAAAADIQIVEKAP